MATNPPITIGELTDVPAPGSGVKSAWAQEVTNRIMHRFASIADRDAKWPAATAGRGATCVTLDADVVWRVIMVGATLVWSPSQPGAEIFYSPITANVSVTATTAAGAQSLINPGNASYDGSPIMVQFMAPGMTPPNVVNGQIAVNLWDANTDLGYLTMVYTPVASAPQIPVFQARRIVPTPGTHNYNLRTWISPSGTGTVVAGTGATGYGPAYLRVTKA